MDTIYLQNWKFHLSDPAEARDLWAPGFDDASWQDVTVPHDWSVSFPFSREFSSGTGYLPGGTGWYRGAFDAAPRKGMKAFISFEGIYKNSQVWCNGYYLGKRPNGYVSFRYDISHCLKEGRNLIAVKVTHEDIADSRWFTGSGIYRRVFIEFCDSVFINPDTTVVKTEMSSGPGGAIVALSGECVNHGQGPAESTVVKAVLEGSAGERYTAESSLPVFAAGAALPFSLRVAVPNPRLWSADRPNLYRLAMELRSRSEGRDVSFVSLPLYTGIRTLRFDADRGFFINGKSEKLKGVCFHHDSGCLGAAFWPDVWRRRLSKLKTAGCNAIRCSHNPQSPELYDLCDEMGFYVMDEAFDEWEGCKNKWFRGHNVYPPVHQGYAEDFPQWHEKDLADLVIRDRNHPSVIMWSIGNEIDYPNDPYVHPRFTEMAGNNDASKPRQEQQYSADKPNMERLAVIAAELAGIVKKYDDTRPVLTAAAFPELSSYIGFFDALDMIGYNYREPFYEADHRRFPKLPIIGSENGHHLAAWKAVTDHEYISGQFLWTGIDFLGEARGWPIRGSGAGILDLAGNEKPGYYRRKILWNAEGNLYLATCINDRTSGEIQPWELSRLWNYTPGMEITVVCYTNLDTAELFVNGRSFGPKDRESSLEYITWQVPFERGKIEARGKTGTAVVSDAIESTLPPVRLALNRWEAASTPNGFFAGAESPASPQLVQIELEVLDEQARLCTTERVQVDVAASGGIKILGMENGDIADCTEYPSPRRRTFHGRLIIYALVPAGSKEPARLEATAEGLPKAVIEIPVHAG